MRKIEDDVPYEDKMKILSVSTVSVELNHWGAKRSRQRYIKYLVFIATGFIGNGGRRYIHVLEFKARSIVSSQGHQVGLFPQGYKQENHTQRHSIKRQCHTSYVPIKDVK